VAHVERLGIARSGARTGASNIDLHVPISRSPVPSIYSRSGCPASRACTRRSSPRSNLHDGSFVPHFIRLPHPGRLIGALPAGLIRAARAIVVGAKAVTRPKPVEQPTRFCLSIYRGTAGTLGFAIPPGLLALGP